MSGYTKGPWEWISDDALWSDKDGEVIVASDDKKAYGMHSALIEHHYDPEIKEANKALICAAPDLFEALIDVIGWIPSHDEAWHTDAPRKAVERARAAIAKATGQTRIQGERE